MANTKEESLSGEQDIEQLKKSRSTLKQKITINSKVILPYVGKKKEHKLDLENINDGFV